MFKLPKGHETDAANSPGPFLLNAGCRQASQSGDADASKQIVALEGRVAALEAKQITNEMEFNDLQTNRLHRLFTYHQDDQSNMWDIDMKLDEWTGQVSATCQGPTCLNIASTISLSNNHDAANIDPSPLMCVHLCAIST